LTRSATSLSFFDNVAERVVTWSLGGSCVSAVLRLEDGGVALLVDEGDGVVDDVAAVRVDILHLVGGVADGSKIEKFSLGASDWRSLRVYSLDPCDLFRGSEVAD
jgi:hypothetical protein